MARCMPSGCFERSARSAILSAKPPFLPVAQQAVPRGLDIAAPLGSPIRNWWEGTVNEVIRDGGGYRNGGVTLRVRTGQVIGHVGMSGSTTGPQLHWGLRYRGQWMDPVPVLRAMAAARR